MTEEYAESAYDLHGLILATRTLTRLMGKSNTEHAGKLLHITEELLDMANARACALWSQANNMLERTNVAVERQP